jgi:RNA polymerase sigma-70 factor (ECF subfamily)
MDETLVVTGGIEEDETDARLARTDTAAFGRLYARHRMAVFRYLRARGFDEDDAADLTALTFERALARLDRYRRGDSGFVAWLIAIARNAAIDAHRRRSVAGRLAFLVREPEWAPSPEDLVIADESDRDLAGRLGGLPPAMREAIVLRYAAGLSAREIGHVIGRSEAASAKLVSRGLAALREGYRDDVR